MSMKDRGTGIVPKHIAIIMDGNGRWAKKRLLPRNAGHKKGMDTMLSLLRHALDRGVDYVTVYALSTENLSRPKKELDALFGLIRDYFESSMKEICERGVSLRILGDASLLPKDVVEILRRAEKNSPKNDNQCVNVALAYGGRQEIVHAVNELVFEHKEITEQSIHDKLYTGGQPDPDLIIRTGKEKRLSNFLLYQSAYSELYFSDKMFPEFSDADLDEAIEEYASRVRRYGKTDEQLEEEKGKK